MTPQDNDAGLIAIGARFSAAAGLGLGAGSADAAAQVLAGPRAAPNPIRQVPLYATEFSGSGTFTQPATLGPGGGDLYWSVRFLSVVGFSAGSVQVLKNSSAGTAVATFAAAGQQYFGRGEVLLHPGDFLVITGATITGTVKVQGHADQFPSWYLTEYLG